MFIKPPFTTSLNKFPLMGIKINDANGTICTTGTPEIADQIIFALNMAFEHRKDAEGMKPYGIGYEETPVDERLG